MGEQQLEQFAKARDGFPFTDDFKIKIGCFSKLCGHVYKPLIWENASEAFRPVLSPKPEALHPLRLFPVSS